MTEANSNVKILIATGLYPPESGGPATFAKFAEDNLQNNNVEVFVVPFSEVRKYPKVIRHVVYFFILLKHSKDINLVLALDPISVGIPARILASIKHVPFIVRLGGDYAWEQGKQRFGVEGSLDDFYKVKNIPLTLKIIRFLQTKVVRSADKVIAPSEYLKSIIGRWGVAENKIEVIYSVSYLESQVIKQHTEFGVNFTDRHPILLSIARLVPWKGFELLIEIVNSLKEKYPSILLLIGGDGPEFSKLEAKIKTLQLEQHVKLLGRMKREEIELISQKVDMFILNTEYEGFSHLLVECMQLGMPIITTNVGGNPELVQNEESGLLVAYNDKNAIESAIIRMSDDEDLRKLFIAQGKVRMQEFSQEKSIERLKQVLINVAKSSV